MDAISALGRNIPAMNVPQMERLVLIAVVLAISLLDAKVGDKSASSREMKMGERTQVVMSSLTVTATSLTE